MYLYFFFLLISSSPPPSPIFFTPLFWSSTQLPNPEVAGGTLPWDLQKSLLNFPLDIVDLNFQAGSAAGCETNSESSKLVVCGLPLGSWLKCMGLCHLEAAKAFEYSHYHHPLPGSSPNAAVENQKGMAHPSVLDIHGSLPSDL